MGQRLAASQVERVFREEHGRILAPLIRILGDFQLAEDALMEAMAQALTTWPEQGLPDNPAAWIVTTAKNRAVDHLRHKKVRREKQAFVEDVARDLGALAHQVDDIHDVKDDQLRLIFTCCHPALGLEAQVALTLRTLGGLSTAEIARAFLQTEPTMAARLTRAKKKISKAKIPFEIPGGKALAERIQAVLSVLYLVFNEGYNASSGDVPIRHDLCREAIRLTTQLTRLLPGECEVTGLLALMLLHDARKDARYDDEGNVVLLEEQDRSLFRRDQIERAHALLADVLTKGAVGPYQVQAAIAALHARAPTAAETNWREIAGLYALLIRMQPTAVVALNRAVAVAMVEGPGAGLSLLAELEDELKDYALWHAARADLLRREGDLHAALVAYRFALERTHNPGDRRFVKQRIRELVAATAPAG